MQFILMLLEKWVSTFAATPGFCFVLRWNRLICLDIIIIIIFTHPPLHLSVKGLGPSHGAGVVCDPWPNFSRQYFVNGNMLLQYYYKMKRAGLGVVWAMHYFSPSRTTMLLSTVPMFLLQNVLRQNKHGVIDRLVVEAWEWAAFNQFAARMRHRFCQWWSSFLGLEETWRRWAEALVQRHTPAPISYDQQQWLWFSQLLQVVATKGPTTTASWTRKSGSVAFKSTRNVAKREKERSRTRTWFEAIGL